MKDSLALGPGLNLNPYDHLASRRELNGVSNQVHYNLLQPGWISDQSVWQFWGNMTTELETFLMSADAQSMDRLFQGVAKIEIGAFDIQLPGFNFRKIQDVVDQ